MGILFSLLSEGIGNGQHSGLSLEQPTQGYKILGFIVDVNVGTAQYPVKRAPPVNVAAWVVRAEF